MTDANEPRNVPAWESPSDSTSELPTAAHGHVQPDRTDEFRVRDNPPVPSDYGFSHGPARRPNLQQPSAQPYGGTPPGRVGNEPVPGAYGYQGRPTGVLRRYSAGPPAAAAALVTAALVAITAIIGKSVSAPSGDWPTFLWWAMNLPSTNHGSRGTGDIMIGALTAGVVVGALVLLAALGATASAARGLIFMATWGAVFLGAILGVLAIIQAEHFDGRASIVAGSIQQGASWAVLLGWIPALLAASFRPGRRLA